MENRYKRVSRWEKGTVQIGYLSATSVVYMEKPGLDSGSLDSRLTYKDDLEVLLAGWH